MLFLAARAKSRPKLTLRLLHRITTLQFIALSAYFSVCTTDKALCADRSSVPNIIVIMADDMGYGDIGCYGSKRIKTPCLDRMAAAGMRLTDFHSSGSVCSPTRAGLVTGRYQQRAGLSDVVNADAKLPVHYHGLHDREVTFAERFASAGYKTPIFGKWHLGYYPKSNPTLHGFDQFRGFISGNIDFFSHVDRAGRADWWKDKKLEDESGYTTHLITKHALEFLDANKDQPFCLYLPHEAPHSPYQGPGDKAIREVGNAHEGKRYAMRTPERIARAYREMVEEMDKGIGQVLAKLKEHKIEDRTIVLFFSDNGACPHGDNGALHGHKGSLWEGGHRVPCIAYWPGKIKPGSVSHDLAITLDIMPTILDVAGIAPPKDRKMDGVSLLPRLIEGKPLGPRKLFWGFGESRAMRDGPWKLVVGPRETRSKAALYNLENDLGEQENLAEKEPERLQKMLDAVKSWEAEVLDDVSPQPTSAR